MLFEEMKDLSKKGFVKVNTKENELISSLVIVFQKIKIFEEKRKERKKEKKL